jgi:hypothetical protein
MLLQVAAHRVRLMMSGMMTGSHSRRTASSSSKAQGRLVHMHMVVLVCLWAAWQRGQHRPHSSSSSTCLSSSSSLLLSSYSKVLLQLAAARLAGTMLVPRRARAGGPCTGPAAVAAGVLAVAAAGVLAVAAAELQLLQGVVARVVAHLQLLLVLLVVAAC